jgi:hypothetical protein
MPVISGPVVDFVRGRGGELLGENPPAERIIAAGESAGPIAVGDAQVTYVDSGYRATGALETATVYAATATPIAEGVQE